MKPSEKIDAKINSYQDWRKDMLSELRALINTTHPELTEDFKWNTAVWTHNGMVCSISGFKDHVKMNFFKGAFLADPTGVFNSGLDSKEHRSINFSESDKLDTKAIKELLQEAVLYNERV